jgi:hypothetical protein
MPVFDRFIPTLIVPRPFAYVLEPTDTAVVARLRLHGVSVVPATAARGAADEFVVDSIVRASRPFQGHNEVRVVGRWRRAAQQKTNVLVVPVGGPLAPLVMYLLDPLSDDGLATWNLFDDRLQIGRAHPVRRIPVNGADGR